MTSFRREQQYMRELEADRKREARGEARRKSPADLVYARLYPGETFLMKKDRKHILIVTRIEGDQAFFARRNMGSFVKSAEFPLSVHGFCAAIDNAPTL